jgi:hypothetical protein
VAPPAPCGWWKRGSVLSLHWVRSHVETIRLGYNHTRVKVISR